jgi:hypothetical protein
MVISLGTATLAVLAIVVVLVVTIATYMFGMDKDSANSAILASAFTGSVMVVSFLILERLYVLIMSW